MRSTRRLGVFIRVDSAGWLLDGQYIFRGSINHPNWVVLGYSVYLLQGLFCPSCVRLHPHLPGEGFWILSKLFSSSSPANNKRQIAVGTTGPQQQAPDRSGHYRASTASARSQWALPGLDSKCQIAVGTAGPQLQSARSQWALPDLNSKGEHMRALYRLVGVRIYVRLECHNMVFFVSCPPRPLPSPDDNLDWKMWV